MKGYSFHAILPPERASKSASKKYPHDPFTARRLKEISAENPDYRLSCMAIQTGQNLRDGDMAIMPQFYGGKFEPRCIVHRFVPNETLLKRTARIPEELARRLHPELFAHLDRLMQERPVVQNIAEAPLPSALEEAAEALRPFSQAHEAIQADQGATSATIEPSALAKAHAAYLRVNQALSGDAPA